MITQQKWKEFSLEEQMANIGSEVVRAINLKEKDDKKLSEGSAWRVLEMVDSTLSDKRWRGKLKEVFFLRDVFCDYFFNYGNFDVSGANLKDYFLPFALLGARKQ